MLAELFLSIALLAQVEPPCWEQGSTLRLDGNFAAAENLLESCLAEDPDDADVLVQLGLSRLPLGDLEGASDAFDRALSIAPDYADASVGLARIAYFEGEYMRALSILNGLGSQSADARTLRADIIAAQAVSQETDARDWRIDLAYAQSGLSEGLPDWSQWGAALSYDLSETRTLTGRISAAERFENTEILGELRLTERLERGGTAYLAVSGAPSATFSPELRLAAGVDGPVYNQFNASLDASLGQYASGTVASLSPGIERVFGDGGTLIGARLIFLRDEAGEIRSGWSVSGETQLGRRVRGLASFTDAPETSEGVTLDVQAVTAGVRFQIDDITGVSVLGVHEMRSAYDRTGIAVSVNRRF